MKNLRKALVVSVMFAMVFSMMSVVAPKANAASGGDLIKMNGLSSVYYLGTDGKRYVFPNENTYFSWYSDFSTVVTISQSELESYPLGANVTMRPGNKLVKITTDPKVYAVEPGGKLVHVPSETVAKTLWGDNWAKRVVDVPDAFFTNYTVTGNQVSATAYPAGSLVKWAGAADVYYIETDGTARKIQDAAAFTGNKFKWDDIVVASVAMPTAGAAITAFDVKLFDPSDGAGGVPGAGTGLTVSLASDTPASMSIPEGSPADFLKFNVTASADGAVSMNSITFRAYDLGTPQQITNVTTFVDGVKFGTGKTMSSDRIATINYSNPITIEAGKTKTIMVKATFGSTAATGNYAIGLASASSILTNGAVISGSFPIIGKSMSAVDGGNIGAVILNGVDDAANTGIKFGEDNVKLAGFNLQTSKEPIIWESARFRNGGNSKLAENVRILVDGTEVATGEWQGDYVVFNMNNYIIAKGHTASVEVYGDMSLGNVGDTVTLYVREADDFSFVGQDMGYGILMTNGLTLASAKVTTMAASDFVIDMDKAATPAKEVRPGEKNVILATLKMTSIGENATIASLLDSGGTRFYITGTGLADEKITNVKMVDVNTGTIYDVADEYNGGKFRLTMNEEISLVKGVTKTFHIKADLSGPTDSTPIDDNDTLQVVLTSDAFTVTGDTSNSDLKPKITPSSVNSSVTTVKTASLTWTTTSLAAKSVVPGAKDEVVYRASLKAGNASEVTLNAVRIDVLDGGANSFKDTNISQLVLKLNNQIVATRSNQITNDGESTGYITFSGLNSNNKIPAGQTYTLEVLASFSSSFNPTGSFSLGMEMNNSTSTTVVRDRDNNIFDETVANVDTASRVVTLASTGSLKVELKTSGDKADKDTYILAGSETTAGRYLGELVFTTANEPVKVSRLALGETGTAGSGDIQAVRLYDKDGNMVAQEGVSSAGHVYFDSLNLIMPADQATSYFIGVVTKSMNAAGDAEGTATYGRTITFRMATTTDLTALGASEVIKASGANSGQDLTIAEANGVVGVNQFEGSATTTKETKIVGSVLTSIVSDMSDGPLTAGTNRIIAKYKFTFNNGNNRTAANEELKARMHSMKLDIASSTNATVSGVQAYIDGKSSIKAAGTETAPGVWTIALGNMTGDTEYVNGTVTLVVTATVGMSSTNNYVSTELSNLASSYFVYNGNHSSTGDLTDMRLDYTEVTGATLTQ
jgi:hypothetical protein